MTEVLCTLLLTAYNDHNCKDSTVGIVKINSDYTLYVPNCFTPNDDGINDVFYAHSVGLRGFEITIFNRWGEVIFESNDINKGWDGKKNGRLVPTGVYIYKIKYIDSDMKKKIQYGKVSVIYIE
jgi:gliding motility-associated-like protein